MKRLLMLALLVVPFGIAFASHPGYEAFYYVLGFTADGKHVYFQKKTNAGPETEHWHAIYDAGTTKLVTSQPTLRACEPMCEGKAEIGEKVGKATVAQLAKKYGAPVATSIVAPKTKPDSAKLHDAVQKPAGAVQEFAAADLSIKTTSKLLGKLADLSDGRSQSVQVEVEIAVTSKSATWTAKHKFYADSVQDGNNGNILLWPALFVEQLAAAPDHKTVALVFARKPFVIKPR